MSLQSAIESGFARIVTAINAVNAKIATGGSDMPIGYLEQKCGASKATLTAVVGSTYSLWRATGYPAQANIPSAVENCTSTTIGAQPLSAATSGTSYISAITVRNTIAGQLIWLFDRLAHTGGLSGILTTAQTVDIDASTLTASAARKGATDYTELWWFMEWYTATGTAVTIATVSVTYSDASTGTLSVSLAASRTIATLIPLNDYIPTAKAGLGIRAVTAVRLNVSTGTAGNFGITVCKPILTLGTIAASYPSHLLYTAATAPDVPNGACLWWAITSSATSTGVFVADFTVIRAP